MEPATHAERLLAMHQSNTIDTVTAVMCLETVAATPPREGTIPWSDPLLNMIVCCLTEWIALSRQAPTAALRLVKQAGPPPSDTRDTYLHTLGSILHAAKPEHISMIATVYVVVYGLDCIPELLLTVLRDMPAGDGDALLEALASCLCTHGCAFTRGAGIPTSIKKLVQRDVASAMARAMDRFFEPVHDDDGNTELEQLAGEHQMLVRRRGIQPPTPGCCGLPQWQSAHCGFPTAGCRKFSDDVDVQPAALVGSCGRLSCCHVFGGAFSTPCHSMEDPVLVGVAIAFADTVGG